MVTIELLSGTRAGERVEVVPPCTLGREPTCAVVLDDSEVAPEQAQLFAEEASVYLQDLAGTAHATRIHRGADEVRLRGTAAVALRHGDILHLGSPGRPVILAVQLEEVGEVYATEHIDLAEFSQRAAEVTRDTRSAPRLLEATQKLARRGLDKREVFEGVAEALFDLVPNATRVAIALAEANFETVYWRPRIAPDKTAKAGAPTAAATRTGAPATANAGGSTVLRVPRAVIRRVERARDAFIALDMGADITRTDSINVDVTSLVAAPLWDGERIRGVLYADNTGAGGKFARADLDLLVTLAAQSTLAIENASLVERLRMAEERLRGENRYLKGREERRRTPSIVGESPAMVAIFRQIEKVKDTRATVAIEGETGTGKELIASAVHYQGSRRDKLFVAQNCAAVPETLLESELFGHKKGAFTGADHDKKGLFEIADGGTLFLDEIGEMSLGLQAKLLRVLQEGEIRPVGATSSRAVDVRIICATNRSLEREVDAGTFRRDLYYRLMVYPIRLPALRERREDIPALAMHFFERYADEMKKPIAGVLPATMDQLQSYNWPGNIRELENEVQRLVIQADSDTYITPEMLSPQVRKVEQLLGRAAPERRLQSGTLKDRVEEVERWLLTEALREHGGNKTRTAETLGITREGLHKKLSKYGL